MKKSFFQAIGIAALLLTTISCSKRTTVPANNQNIRQERPQGQGNRLARGGAPQFSDLLAQMDANKDRKLSKTEVKGPLQNDFSKVDKNSDGYISESEFKQAPLPQRQRPIREK